MRYKRSELREKIMVILYQIYLYKKQKIDFEIENVIKENISIENSFIKDIVYGVLEKEKEINDIINTHLNNWTIDRLGLTDQAILRIGTYELLYYETPNIVSINEAVELAKKYSDEKVIKMINATLDKILINEEENE